MLDGFSVDFHRCLLRDSFDEQAFGRTLDLRALWCDFPAAQLNEVTARLANRAHCYRAFNGL